LGASPQTPRVRFAEFIVSWPTDNSCLDFFFSRKEAKALVLLRRRPHNPILGEIDLGHVVVLSITSLFPEKETKSVSSQNKPHVSHLGEADPGARGAYFRTMLVLGKRTDVR
jgi:hypothetical protein